jgi:uncharacterized protein CbrC (UPF0167 family)
VEFTYFRAPGQHMAGLGENDVVCTFCDAVGPCFALAGAHCPSLTRDEKGAAFGCFACLKSGRFEFSHDTEIGMLTERGLKKFYSHNARPPADFPHAALRELRRTPQIVMWQQEVWPSHCNDFMAYIGTWEPRDFASNAADGDGRALFLEMTDPARSPLWDRSLRPGEQEPAAWYATYYAFRCLHCQKLRGYWDCP